MSLKKIKTIDLFAGIGGIRKGFEETSKFETVFANDIEPSCKVTYDMNFDTVPLTLKDVRDINSKNLPLYDFLLAGFPCQAFSIAGYRHGFDDKKGRGNLFFEITRIILETKPSGFFLENVKNLYTHDNGNTFKVIQQTLRDLGYHIKHAVLNAMDYGNVPQNRERIYIVGFKDANHFNHFHFPEKIPLTKTIQDILKKDVSNEYYYENKPLMQKLQAFEIKQNTVYQWRRIYLRENKKGVFPTLTANMGTGGHNVPIILDSKGIRKITPTECADIMGYENIVLPTTIAQSKLYTQMGNSVVVPVIRRIAQNISYALSQ